MNPQIMQLDTSRLSPKEAEAAKPEISGSAENLPAEPQSTPPAEPLSWDQIEELKNKIVAVLCTCFDPEIPVNIYELGLIYDIEIAPSAEVKVRMTLTTPACPAAGSLPPEVERKVRDIPGVAAVKVDVVWDPPWDKNRMSEAAKLQLGIDD
jgi:FeS assembly SUF system protein